MRKLTITLALLMMCAAAFAAAPAPGEQDRRGVPLAVDTRDPKAIKIVILAGGNLTPTKRTGEHEYFAGSVVLMNMLKQTPGVHPVLIPDGWPTPGQEKILDNARAVVFYMDGVGAAPHTQSPERMDLIQKLVDKGIGIVHLHQVIDYPADTGQRALPWLGGVFVPGVGTRGHWDETFSTLPDHPVTRGVTPFTVNDGFILKLNWAPGMKGVTPLLHTWNPKSKDKPSPTDTIVAWTYNRPPGMGGGRSFVFTGMHAHNEWAVESLRRFVTNGVLWAANVEIPSTGAPVAMDPADINKHLDIRVKPAPKPKAKAKK